MHITTKINYNGIDFDISMKHRKGEETIILIHGLIGSKGNFRTIWNIPYFDKFGILSFDLPGFGKSSKPKDFSYDMKDQAKICKLIIEKLNLKNIHLVCHSMGGVIGLMLIEMIPERMKSFSNLEGNLVLEDASLSREINDLTFEEFESGDLLGEKDDHNIVFKSSKSIIHWTDTGNLLERFIDLELNKTYFYGEKHRLTSVELLKGKVETIMISKSGHFLMRDNPEELYSKLAEFI